MGGPEFAADPEASRKHRKGVTGEGGMASAALAHKRGQVRRRAPPRDAEGVGGSARAFSRVPRVGRVAVASY